MALQLDLAATPIGVAFNAAYARIQGVYVEKTQAFVTVGFYASQDARDGGAQPFMTKRLDFDGAKLPALSGALSGTAVDVTLTNFYDGLKQLPDFAGATDC